jgi:hypothetical protein
MYQICSYIVRSCLQTASFCAYVFLLFLYNFFSLMSYSSISILLLYYYHARMCMCVLTTCTRTTKLCEASYYVSLNIDLYTIVFIL